MAYTDHPSSETATTPDPTGHIVSRRERAARQRTAAGPAMIDPTTEEGLRAAGYAGFVTVGSLRETGFSAIPETPGVYLTLYPSGDPPRFLPVSPAGTIAGESATLPVGELERDWVPGALVLYAGLAGGKGKPATLRSRVEQFLDFGRGRKVRHRDGRAVWQIARSSMLVMCWLATPGADPWGKRKTLLTAFADRIGSPPFANRAGRPDY